MVLFSSLVDTYGVYSYKSPLIWFGIENFDNWKHREMAIKKDWVAKCYITKLDSEMFAEYPIFTPNIFGAGTTEAEPSADLEVSNEAEDVSEEWELEDWNGLCIRYQDLARIHRFCIVQLYDRKPYWKVFSWREITEIKYDKNDNPIGAKVEWALALKGTTQFRHHIEHLKFYNEEKEKNDGTALLVPFGKGFGGELGENDLEHIWGKMIQLRYIDNDIVNNSAKSSGFYHYVYGDALSETQLVELKNAADVAGSGRAIGAKETLLKEIRAIFPQKPEFSVEAKEDFLMDIAGACRLPLEFFRGEKQKTGLGSGFGGYVEEEKINKEKRFVFGKFKHTLKTLIKMRWGIIIEDVELYEEEPEMEEISPFGQEKEQKGGFNDKK